MGRVIVSTMVSLDGVMDAPDTWAFDLWDEEQGRWALEELLAVDALLLGRKTYEGFVGYWPSASDEDGLAERMNGIPKFVASRSLQTVGWNATLIAGDVAAEVSRLTRETNHDLLLFASADLLQTVMQHDLVDEYRLRVAPVIVGRGKHLFGVDAPRTSLRTVNVQTSTSGVVVLTLRPER